MKRLIALLFYLVVINAEAISLSDLAHETDKGPSGHNYTPIYHNYFNDLRQKPIKFLEIGFLVGGSARMWDKYFSQAELHFMDISNELFEKYGHGLSNRCHFHVVDQSNTIQLEEFITKVGGDFDVIIDDGGHHMHQQLNSFKTLFPTLKSGGIYVIEDLHTSYWARFGGSGEIGSPNADGQTTIRFLQGLVDDVGYIGALTGYADPAKCPNDEYQKMNYYQQHIHSIHFYGSICFVIKR